MFIVYGFTNQGVTIHYILSILNNHDFIIQLFLVQYPYKVHNNKEYEREKKVKYNKCAWQFGDEQGVPGAWAHCALE